MAGLYARLALGEEHWRRDALLERLLAIAPPPTMIDDWRDDAQALLQAAGAPRLGAAAIVHRGLVSSNDPDEASDARSKSGNLPVQGYVLLMSPLYIQASMSSVRLPIDGVLSLSAEEARTLARDHAARLGGPDRPRLIAGTRGELLLWSEQDFQVHLSDPGMLQGYDLREVRPRGAGAARLQAWSSETQMWLFDHPLNRARVTAGQPPVGMLWPWGAAAVRQQLPAPAFAVSGSDEIFDRWQATASSARSESHLLLASGDASGFARQIETLRATLRPTVRAGGQVHLSAGRWRYSLQRLPRRWLAPRPRAWWEYFLHVD